MLDENIDDRKNRILSIKECISLFDDESKEIKIKFGLTKDNYFCEEITKHFYIYMNNFLSNIISSKNKCIYWYICRHYFNSINVYNLSNTSSIFNKKKNIYSYSPYSHICIDIEKETHEWKDIPNNKSEYDLELRSIKIIYKLITEETEFEKDIYIALIKNVITKNTSNRIIPEYQCYIKINKQKISIKTFYSLLKWCNNIYSQYREYNQHPFIIFNNFIDESFMDNEIKNKYYSDYIFKSISDRNMNFSHQNPLNDPITKYFFDREKPKLIQLDENNPFDEEKDFIYFPKPNGEIYFLYIDNEKNFYYISDELIIKPLTKKDNLDIQLPEENSENNTENKINIYNETLFVGYLSGEYNCITNKHSGLIPNSDKTYFIIYDVIIVNGENLLYSDQLNYIERYNFIKTVIDDLKLYLNCDLIPIVHSKVSKLAKNIKKIVDKSSELNENNGIILKNNTNPDESYLIINNDNIIINLALYIDHESTNNTKKCSYNFYTINCEDGNFEEFKGTEKNSFNSNISLNYEKFGYLQNGTIVLCKYNKISNSFDILDILNDEVLPITTQELSELWDNINKEVVEENNVDKKTDIIEKIKKFK